MSSAILYLAIVAIWACVLIPRWLRRDSARAAAAPAVPAVPAVPAAEPAPLAADGLTTDDGVTFDQDEFPDTGDPGPQAIPAPVPASPGDSRRRMLAARRRLLLMLAGLEIAAIVLAFLGLAAVWVVVPPTIMLAGYLLLLREAARADAERAQYEAEAAARVQARSSQTRLDTLDTPAEGTPIPGTPIGTAEAESALAAKFAAAPVPADYQDSGPGRDFAPGLAGKYTTSNADAEADDDHYYDSYEMPRLRAVGD